MYMDEAGFNLTKRRRRGRNVIGHRAIVGVPGQRGGNVTLCAAISNHDYIKVYERQPYTRVNLLQAMGLFLWWHRCGGMPSLDTACQVFFPPLPGQTKCGLWCGWSPVAWPSTETWCCGWVMHLFVYFCTLFLHGLTVHKWQTHKISVCFYMCYV